MKSSSTKPKTRSKAAPGLSMESESVRSPAVSDRFNCIATAAYYKAEARGFAPGRELDDWLEAQTEFGETEGGRHLTSSQSGH